MKNTTTIQGKIANIKDWLCFNSTGYPYLIGIGVRQWTAGVKRNYPDFKLISVCGIRYSKEGSELQYFASSDEYRESADALFNNLDQLSGLYADFEKAEVELKDFYKKIDDKGEQYLFDNYEEFIRLYDNEYIIGALVDGFLIFSEELFANLRKKYAKYENEMNVLVQPYGETFNAREHRSLLKIAITAKTSKDQNLDKLLDEHRQTFHWMQNNYKNIEGLSLDYFKEKLDELLVKDIDVLKEELNALELAIKKHQDFCSAIKERSIFESADYEHLLWLGKIAWWVDRRKEYNLIANYYIGRHLRYLCEQKSLTYEDVVYLFPWELDSVLSGRTHLADYPLESRKGNWLHFYDVDDQELVMTSKDEKDFLQRALPKISNGQEVKGMIANKGKATGVVRVVMDAHNVKEFNEGEILVTGMTRPDFLGLMKKAAAFVTDEGGVTCHAAIVSRELGKPCIIGTKIATKVLKDGDLVEVDANKGIVNILEK